jgi:hypothetical protein
MTHIAIQEALDGKVVTWMEHVRDEEYLAGPCGSHFCPIEMKSP